METSGESLREEENKKGYKRRVGEKEEEIRREGE